MGPICKKGLVSIWINGPRVRSWICNVDIFVVLFQHYFLKCSQISKEEIEVLRMTGNECIIKFYIHEQ